MLLFVFGPTGVGKTEIMRCLVRTDALRYISPDTTRSLRFEETDKRYVSDATFDERLARGEYAWVTHLFNARYGTPRVAVEEALNQLNPSHVLDFPLGRLEEALACSGYNDFIVLMPASVDALLARLENAGRCERATEAKRELAAYQDAIDTGPLRGKTDRVFINDDITQTALAVSQFIRSRMER
jgi:guanylate kinase